MSYWASLCTHKILNIMCICVISLGEANPTWKTWPQWNKVNKLRRAIQDASGKCLTEEWEIPNRWTEYWSGRYNYKANWEPWSVLNCPQTDIEDDHPVLRKEVEAAVQSLKKGKSAGVDSIPTELVQAGGKDVITALTTICNKIWQTGEWPTWWTQSLVITLAQERQYAAVPELPNDQPHQAPKQSHAEDHIEQTEPASGEDHYWRTASVRARRCTTEQIFNLRILCEKDPQHQQDLYHGFRRGLACIFVGNHEEVQHQCQPYPSY